MTMTDLGPAATAVVGVADLVSPTGTLGKPARALEAEAIAQALNDAGLSLNDVDGLFAATGVFPTLDLAEYFGIQPRYTDSTMTGGSSFEVHVEHAAMALSLGLCDVALIVYAQTPIFDFRSAGSTADKFSTMFSKFQSEELLQWEAPYGAGVPSVPYALAATRHMAEFGTTSEQLAAIAVSTRQWAAFNPRAKHRAPITVDDVLASPLIVDPLHRLDCCVLTDGAGAVIMTRADRARDLRQPPVYVLGCATAHTHGMVISQMPDLTRTAGSTSGPLALKRAGVTVGDIDVLETYDSFTITVLLALEDIGFCGKGEGGAFVSDGALAPGGTLPTNTSGGGLSYTHPGMFGIFLIVEAVRQLRGARGDGQVPGAELAVAHGCGGMLSATGTIVLGKDRP